MAEPSSRQPQRAADTRHPTADQRQGEARRRRRQTADSQNRLHVDPATIPEGWAYQWKLKSVLGQQRNHLTIHQRDGGFTPVDPARHPDLFPGQVGTAEIDGLVLMERPIELEEEARQEDYDRAVGQLQNQLAQLRLADNPAAPDLPRTPPIIRRSIERGNTPVD